MRRQGISGPVRPHRGPPTAFFPAQTARDVTVVSIVLIALFALAWRGMPAMEGPADPTDATFIPRPEWYFLGLFQLLKYFPGKLEVVGAIIIPTAARRAARAAAVARSRARTRPAPPPRGDARRRGRRARGGGPDHPRVARQAGVGAGGGHLVDARDRRPAVRGEREVRALPLGERHGRSARAGLDVARAGVADRTRRRCRDDRPGPARAAHHGLRARSGGAGRLRPPGHRASRIPATRSQSRRRPASGRATASAATSIDGDGGSDGPELSQIGSKHDAATLNGWIADPEAVEAGHRHAGVRQPADRRSSSTRSRSIWPIGNRLGEWILSICWSSARTPTTSRLASAVPSRSTPQAVSASDCAT